MQEHNTLPSISPQELDALRESGQWIDLIDVSSPAEFWEMHVPLARNVPIDSPELEAIIASPRTTPDQPRYVMCLGGVRGKQVCAQFADDNVVNVEGGTHAWEKSGLRVVRSQDGISLDRQAQIVAGTLIVLGSALALFLDPYFAVLPLLAGTGLVVAGSTGRCALGALLARLAGPSTSS
jgi:rhodanese-related sulfurtransferase